MKYDELLMAGKAMKPEEVNGTIKELAKDPRFAAVVVWVERNKVAFNDAVVSQGIAAHHGSLAHAAGSGYAIRQMEAQLRNLIDPAPAQAKQRRQEEG